MPEGKVQVVYDWFDDRHIGPREHSQRLAEELGFAGRFNLLFAGNMGILQALDTVIDAAAVLADRVPKARFVLVGDGVESTRLRARAEELRLPNAAFLERRPVEGIGELVQLADGLLVTLADNSTCSTAIPSKTTAYMGSYGFYSGVGRRSAMGMGELACSGARWLGRGRWSAFPTRSAGWSRASAL